AVAIAPETGEGMLRIHQPGEHPVRLFLIIRRQRDVVVRFHAAVDTKRPLDSVQRGERSDSSPQAPERLADSHVLVLTSEDSTLSRRSRVAWNIFRPGPEAGAAGRAWKCSCPCPL